MNSTWVKIWNTKVTKTIFQPLLSKVQVKSMHIYLHVHVIYKKTYIWKYGTPAMHKTVTDVFDK